MSDPDFSNHLPASFTLQTVDDEQQLPFKAPNKDVSFESESTVGAKTRSHRLGPITIRESFAKFKADGNLGRIDFSEDGSHPFAYFEPKSKIETTLGGADGVKGLF
ncbi:hypothetical protein FRC11_012684 [Ceratobasidium sp. 423]|nr:hypothetical protein FRC11_012684 [Ceratobasidium sp. 423]